MPRALTVTAATVSEADLSEYLARLAQEAGRFQRRGGHLWLFRHHNGDGRFLEFREAPDPELLGAADDDWWLEQPLTADPLLPGDHTE